ncbi:multiple sugar transport system permease protein/putative aldouronate transport system permease protein [Paenibacillus catalpae]|uniref:Multiple sugar transport system permease protein/putative aldouronate transport system permease protein n=1 Tax=Paenibacillus catalpae TaxID=1045775 RepID=A0A1I1XSB1_9BACL|nr:carbohydrate ABC transporter permease [Paenibacillus catalpae]SFE10119.1 multiple sugar transport system permease protein/putative aldouronate transport system permease protein [Paenibacillus catalpae]
MIRREHWSRKWFLIANYVFLAGLSLTMLLPFLNVIAQSLSGAAAIDRGDVMFWPVDFTLNYYRYVFDDVSIWRAFGITVYITVLGTLINLAATSSLAYPLSRTEYVGRKYVLLFVLMTMIFTAPLIPQFILMREIHLINTLWALMIPTAISAFNLIVLRSFFVQIPTELIDSARIDGCGELRILWSLMLPLSKPALATVGIFYSVTNWNKYMDALYYLNDRRLYPLQVKLRELLINDDLVDTGNLPFDIASQSVQGVQMAVILVATVPIIMLYPFMQRYFIKGMLIGSIKS